MEHNYLSIFSRDYIYKGLALYRSLEKHDSSFRFYFVCLDNETIELLKNMQLKNAVLLSINDIEAQDKALAQTKLIRNTKEYIWTAKASAILYIFENYPDISNIIWLDGDTMFLSSPEAIYSEWGDYSILLTKEHYSGPYEYMSSLYGKYNTGFMGFKRDENTLKCLEWFRAKLIEWCYDKHEAGKWSDQMYVCDWTESFDNVGIIKSYGINMTPFILKRRLSEGNAAISYEDSNIYIGNDRLILFHYYGLKYINKNEFDLCSYKNWEFPASAIDNIYLPYLISCRKAIAEINSYYSGFYKDKHFTSECAYYYNISDRGINYEHQTCFCTITTKHYAFKSAALYKSIKEHVKNFHLWICCMDDDSYDMLNKMELSDATLIKYHQLEDSEIAAIKESRSITELCWTLKPQLMLYILKNYSKMASILYIDSDIYIFSNPYQITTKLKRYSVLLTHHNFTKDFRYIYTQKGKYNAGLVGFKNDDTGLYCLNWWRSKCIEWCYDQIKDGKFADQKYLEELPKLTSSIYVAQQTGGNAAIWNIRGKKIRRRNKSIYIDNSVLIFYHFSSLIILGEKEFDLWKWANLGIGDIGVDNIYIPYINTISQLITQAKAKGIQIEKFFEKPSYVPNYIKLT